MLLASLLLFSEVLAEESIVCLQKALNHLREIWELIGIPEDQRLQRTEVVKKHIKVSGVVLVSLRQFRGKDTGVSSDTATEVTRRCHRLFLVFFVFKSFLKNLKL